VTEPNAAWYCWHAHRRAALIERVWAELGVLNHQQIVWVKPTALHGYSFWPYRHEPCLMGWRKGHKPDHDGDNSHRFTTVWEIDWEGKARIVGNEHPTQKPVGLFERPMLKHTKRGDVCFEPFCGSGSQLIAAERLERRCYALEIEPRFCDVAVERWEQFTGKAAERAT
jgi:DNA modification methylase